MTLTEFLQALENTAFATAVREGAILFPFAESTHVAALAFVIGTVVFVDLRLLGLASRDQPVTRLTNDPAALDVGRLRDRGDHWPVAVLLDTGAVLHEHVLPLEVLLHVPCWREHADVPLRHAEEREGMGQRSRPADSGQSGRCVVDPVLGMRGRLRSLGRLHALTLRPRLLLRTSQPD
jgi:hypothetical protein